MTEPPLIGIVGACASGKTTLAASLRQLGYRARPIAQEHSYVADMWQRITRPDLLICLEVGYAQSLERRRLNWTLAEYEEQLHRLRHARQHADLTVDTNPLNALQVLAHVIRLLADAGVSAPAPPPAPGE